MVVFFSRNFSASRIWLDQVEGVKLAAVVVVMLLVLLVVRCDIRGILMVDKNDLALGVLAGKTLAYRFVNRKGEYHKMVHLQAGLRDAENWAYEKWTGEFYDYTVCGIYVCPVNPRRFDGYHKNCCNPAWRGWSTVAHNDPDLLDVEAVCGECREGLRGSGGDGVL